MSTARYVFNTMYSHSLHRFAEEYNMDVKSLQRSSARCVTARNIADTVDKHYEHEIRRGINGYHFAISGIFTPRDPRGKKGYAEKTGISLQRALRLVIASKESLFRGYFENTRKSDMDFVIHALTWSHEGRTRHTSYSMTEMVLHYSSSVFALWLYHHDQLFPLIRHVIREMEQDTWFSLQGEKDQADVIRMVMPVLCNNLIQNNTNHDVPWVWQEHVLVAQANDPDLIRDVWQDAQNIVLHTAPIRATLGRLSLTPWWLQW